MSPDVQLIVGALSAVITTLAGLIAWLYRDAMQRADDRLRGVEDQRDTLLKEFAATLRQIATTVDAMDKNLDRTVVFVEDMQAEARVEARQQAKHRQLQP